jgi:hypothetical protein
MSFCGWVLYIIRLYSTITIILITKIKINTWNPEIWLEKGKENEDNKHVFGCESVRGSQLRRRGRYFRINICL